MRQSPPASAGRSAAGCDAGPPRHRLRAPATLRSLLLTGALAAAIDGLQAAEPFRPEAALTDTAGFAVQRLKNSVSLHAKLLCSGVFVSGRDPERIIAEDLTWPEYHFHDWNRSRWTLDRAAGTVRLSTPVPGAAERFKATAVYHPGHGCTLLPQGAERVAFTPRGPAAAAPDRRTWPPGDLSATGSARDPQAMRRVVADAFADDGRAAPQNTRAIVVIHNGKIVAERYAEGFGPQMPMLGWSMGKSISTALLGIMVRQTGLDVAEPAPVARWRADSDPRSAITVLHLMQMAGGLRFSNPPFGETLYYTDLHEHESVYFRGQNTERLSIDAPLQYAPGTVFQYRNSNTLALMSLMKAANVSAGDDHLRWPHEALFERIGAHSFVLEPDPYGNMIVTGFVYATARDWGRLGLFFLGNGVADGQPLWPDDWLALLTRPSAAKPNYGGQVWLNTTGMMPNVPADAFFFRGWLGQLVIVIPSLELVVVRLGFSSAGGYLDYADGLIRQLRPAL